jgi:hypothetical protein
MMQGIRRAIGFSLVCAGLACAGLMSLTVLSAQTPDAQTPNWQTYSYPSDGFSASFPAQPEQQKQNVSTAAGPFELRGYLVTVGPTALFAAICDYGSAASGRDPQTMLSGAQQGALDNTKAHLISSSKVTLGTYPGLAFEAENDSMHFSARIYMVGSSLYQTLVASPLAEPYGETTRFLDSFQLIARTTP